MNRGYPSGPSVRFVSDHHRLPEEQRFVLKRVVVPAGLAEARRAKALPASALSGQRILVDGYNVLITVESLLLGRPVYLCDDGFLRDTAGIFRSYRPGEMTERALHEIISLLLSTGPSAVELLLDQQISRSGDLAARIRAAVPQWTARTARDVDRQLKDADAIVATSDGSVIDATSRPFDLPGELARRRGLQPLQI